MAKLILVLMLLVSSNAFSLSVISDLDDTLKITNVENKPRAVWNALFNKSAFKGMPEFLNLVKPNDLYIVSASPNLLNARINAFIDHNKIEVNEIHTRELSELGQKRKYKLETMREILKRSQDQFILMGDNVEIDESIYQQIQKEFPEQVVGIYTHKVSSDKKIEGLTFHTAFDLAIHEFKAERLTQFQILNFAKDFLLIRKLETVLPSFKYCPKLLSEFDLDLPFVVRQAAKQVYKRLNSYCQSRNL